MEGSLRDELERSEVIMLEWVAKINVTLEGNKGKKKTLTLEN